MYLKTITILLLLWATAQVACGQIIVVSVNSWMEQIDENDLSVPLEAGYDLEPALETAANFNQMDILNLANSKGWKVTVSRNDINWPAALSLTVRRTSMGTPCMGCAGVNSGLSPNTYMPVTGTPQDFIYGTGEVNDINIQMKVEGLSLTIEAGTYSTEVIYTLFGD